MLLSTTSSLDGKTIKEYRGIVFGEVISGIHFIKDFTANITNFVGGRVEEYEQELVGDEFNLEMYTSTSLNENIAKTFAEDKENAIMLEIKVPKKTKCLYIGNNSAYEFEAELLLARNLKYKVINMSEDKIILEVIQ